MENPDTSTQAVEEVMVSDQSICTRILRIANTSFYRGNREKVTCANEAIGTIGFDKIKDVILTTSVFKVFSGKESAGMRIMRGKGLEMQLAIYFGGSTTERRLGSGFFWDAFIMASRIVFCCSAFFLSKAAACSLVMPCGRVPGL